MRRVVVTGLGMVTPLACGVEETWERILDGQSGAGTIAKFDASHLATDYACEIPLGDGSDGTSDGGPGRKISSTRQVSSPGAPATR